MHVIYKLVMLLNTDYKIGWMKFVACLRFLNQKKFGNGNVRKMKDRVSLILSTHELHVLCVSSFAIVF